MSRQKRISHVEDDVILSFTDDGAPIDAASRTHIADCVSCTRRVNELRGTRRLLQAVATRQRHPHHDIAQGAIGRLRIRQKAIGNMNEVLAAVHALFRGLADLFGGGPSANTAGPVPRHDEGTPHG